MLVDHRVKFDMRTVFIMMTNMFSMFVFPCVLLGKLLIVSHNF